MKDEAKVFCAKTGDKHEWKNVSRLAAMFGDYLHLPFTFVCSSSSLSHAPLLPNVHMQYTYPRKKCDGKWNLQEGYSNAHWAEGCPVIICDLLTVITEDITEIIRERIAMNRLTLDANRDCFTFVPAGGVPELWEDFCALDPGYEFAPHPMTFNADRLIRYNIPHDFWKPTAPNFILLD